MLCWTSPGAGHNAAEAPTMFQGMSDADSGDSLSHITGLVNLLVIGLLVFPIWLFGLLIGLLLPKGFSESRAASAVTESMASGSTDVGNLDDLCSSTVSSVRADISSRPLSDDELASSSDEEEDQGDQQEHEHGHKGVSAVHPAGPGCRGLISRVAGTGRSAVAAQHTVSWAQQLHQLLSSKPTTGATSRTNTHAAEAPAGPCEQAPHTASSPTSPTTPSQLSQDMGASGEQQPRVAAASGVGRARDKLLLSGEQRQHQREQSPSHHQRRHSGSAGAAGTSHWYISQSDCDKFNSTLAPVEERLLSGNLGLGWNLIMDKEVPGVVRYASYWRPTDSGSTDYLSVTIIPDATAQELHEYNLDDVTRSHWDPMLKSTWLLASRDTAADEQLVVWLRSFPMGFLSDRLYAGIARRTFTDSQQPSCRWGVSKVVHNAVTAAWAAEHFPGVIQTDNYYSAWRCRTIPAPWPALGSGANGGSQPACEMILLHHDELKIPEYLSRMAIKVGMWKFVQGMVDSAGTWLEQRRTRVDPFQPDPDAACRQAAPPLTGAAAAAAAEAAATLHNAGSTGSGGNAAGGASNMDMDDGLLLSPRRLHTVPTAPDLLSLSGDVGDADLCGTTGNSVSDYAPLAAAAFAKDRHRRGHSMDWTPKPDSVTGAVSSSGMHSDAAGADDSHGDSGAVLAAGRSSLSAALAAAVEDLHVDLPPIITSLDASGAGFPESPVKQQQQQQQRRIGVLEAAMHPVKVLVALPGSFKAAVAGFVDDVSRRAVGVAVGVARGIGKKPAAAAGPVGQAHDAPHGPVAGSGAQDVLPPPEPGSADGEEGLDVAPRTAGLGSMSGDQGKDGVLSIKERSQKDQVAAPQAGQAAAAAAAAAAGMTGASMDEPVRGRSSHEPLAGSSGGRSRSTSSSTSSAPGQPRGFMAVVCQGLVRGAAAATAMAIVVLLAGAAPVRGVADAAAGTSGKRRSRKE